MKRTDIDIIETDITNSLTRKQGYVRPLKDKFDTFNNLTYFGETTKTGSSSGFELVYSINSNYFLRFGAQEERAEAPAYNTYANLNMYVSHSNDLTNINISNTNKIFKFVTGYNLISEGANNARIKSSFFTITDTQDNVKVLWNFKAGTRACSQLSPIMFTKTITNKDILITFPGAAHDPAYVYYLDDDNYTQYYLLNDYRYYNVSGKCTKITNIPIMTWNNTNSGNTIVDAVSNELVILLNSDINSIHDNGIDMGSNASNYKNLVKVDNTYYRQIAGNYWFVDPKKDETPDLITNVTT